MQPNRARQRMIVSLLASLALLAVLPPAQAADPSGKQVVVTLKGGNSFPAVIVSEDDKSVTLRALGGTIQISRSEIEKIDGGGGARPPSSASTGKSPAATAKAIDASILPKAEPWSDAEEQKIEDILNRFFAAGDEASRKSIHAELAKTKLDRRFEDLETLREAGGKAKGLQKHLPVPWRKGADRGWYNLAIPKDYTPAKAWPLVLGLHGMPSDGDNLISWYCNYFPPRGYIVLFPTTIQRSSFWPAPNEKSELLRLLRHVSRSYRIDYRRIYCTGASGGGIGTWHWLVTLPELFAGGISFSAAGTIFDKRLEKLKGVPFYVHHGTADPISIASVDRSVEMAQQAGATIEFYRSEGTGHTPPDKEWVRGFDWLVKQPPKTRSPRYLLETPEGALPVGYARHLPFCTEPEAGALAKVRAAAKGKAGGFQAPDAISGGDLLDGLVAIARIVDSGCAPGPVREEVKRIAGAARTKAAAGSKPAELLGALNDVFFHVEGFSRDGADPTGENPDNYAIHRVLKARRGSPFTLAGLYVAVAAELGLPVYPVTTPYHAFARFDDGQETVNVEMSESGGAFDDKVYLEGYGLPSMPPASTLKSKGTVALLAAHLGALGSSAQHAGQPEKAAAAAKAALALDPQCLAALLIQASAARESSKPAEALKLAQRAASAWPEYAAPRLIEGELIATNGSWQQAVAAYEKGIAAPLKPYGAAAAYNAELYYRIASIYAPLLREARLKVNPIVATYSTKFNEAIHGALKNNLYHPGARKLLVEMGGRIRG